jgi:hypothetical protein
MTTHKAPTTVEAALGRIMGQIHGGAAKMAEITSRKEHMIYAWGNPTRREKVPVEDAILLDLAFQAAGGIGAPLHEFYSLQLELETATRFAEQQALNNSLPIIIKEVSEAEIAIHHASRPDASARDMSEGMREVEEAIAALRAPLAVLKRLHQQLTGARDTMSP